MWLLDTKFSEPSKLYNIPEHELTSSDEGSDSSGSEASLDDAEINANYYAALSYTWGTAGGDFDWSGPEDTIQESTAAARVKYAILSHTWGHDKDEITFEQMRSGTYSRDSKGWFKIQQCRRQAAADRYDFVWVDTCCIDKSSSAELQEAINSMYYWYQRAAVCYVYLADFDLNGKSFVATQHKKCGKYKNGEPQSASKISAIRASAVCDYYQITNQARSKLENEFIASLWFTRGWTLQELLAPANITFFDSSWQRIGTKASMLCPLSEATGIPKHYLETRGRGNASVAERFSWASNRQTTRIEDRAYSLLGIFGVNMPLLYGERHKAFIRLQEEIIKRSDDQSIFWWTRTSHSSGNDLGVMAPNLRCFSQSKGITHLRSVPRLFSITNRGVSIEVAMTPWTVDTFIAFLNCSGNADGDRNRKSIFLRVIDDDENNHYARVLVDGMHSPTENSDFKHSKNGLAMDLILGAHRRTVHILHRHSFKAHRMESSVYLDRLNGFEIGKPSTKFYERIVCGRWSEKWQAVYSEPGSSPWPVAVLKVKIAGCRVKFIALGFEVAFDRRSVPLLVFAVAAGQFLDLHEQDPNLFHIDHTTNDAQLAQYESRMALDLFRAFTRYQPKDMDDLRVDLRNPIVKSSSDDVLGRVWSVRLQTIPRTLYHDRRNGKVLTGFELAGGYESGAWKTKFCVGLTPFGCGRSMDGLSGNSYVGGPLWRISTSAVAE